MLNLNDPWIAANLIEYQAIAVELGYSPNLRELSPEQQERVLRAYHSRCGC